MFRLIYALNKILVIDCNLEEKNYYYKLLLIAPTSVSTTKYNVNLSTPKHSISIH